MSTRLKLGLFALLVAIAAPSAGCCWHERGYAHYSRPYYYYGYHHHRHWDGGYYYAYPR